MKGTHYVFTTGKDGALKYWDADRWELLLSLGGHRGESWALAVSSLGDFAVTGVALSCQVLSLFAQAEYFSERWLKL